MPTVRSIGHWRLRRVAWLARAVVHVARVPLHRLTRYRPVCLGPTPVAPRATLPTSYATRPSHHSPVRAGWSASALGEPRPPLIRWRRSWRGRSCGATQRGTCGRAALRRRRDDPRGMSATGRWRVPSDRCRTSGEDREAADCNSKVRNALAMTCPARRSRVPAWCYLNPASRVPHNRSRLQGPPPAAAK